MVEVFYPFENDKPLICYCNEEGKYNGMEPNWVWFDESGLVPRDVVMGPILVCGDAGDGTERSLSGTEIEFVTEFFSRNRCIGDVVKKNKITFSK